MGRLKYPYRLGSRFPARRPGHYTLDPYLVLDIPFLEGSGSKVEDRSVHKNIGTITGPTWNAKGLIGPCLDYDGFNDYVTCGNPASLKLSTITWETWVRPLDQTKATIYHIIVGKAAVRYGGLYLRYVSNAVAAVVFAQLDLADTVQLLLSSASAGNWYHLVGVGTATKMQLYVNGVLTGTATGSFRPTTDTENLTMGNFPGRGAAYGKIDQVRVFSRELTAQEILDRYESMKP